MKIDGKIKVAVDQGRYILAFEDDVRVMLCASLDQCIERMFADSAFASVSIDLTQATGIDSTTLGLLAKLALRAELDYEMQPLLFSSNKDINYALSSMGLDDVFSIQHCEPDIESCHHLLEELECDEDDEVDEDMMRKHVIEAHQALMDLNQNNRLKFQDLMDLLD
jgi:anti-anti-sigma regulatory factor